MLGWVFFEKIVKCHSKGIVVLSSNLKKKILTVTIIFVKLRGFKDCHFGQIGTINARYISRY